MSPAGLGTGVLPSPNIWRHPQTYELLDRAADRDGLVDAALEEVRPMAGRTVVDVGCGTGYHLPAYARCAASVIGVEPHPGLVRIARRRIAAAGSAGQDRVPCVVVREGTAQSLPLADASVDLVVARWAYFFGPGCEPGIAEARRVLRRGGALVVVDLDVGGDGYAHWFRRAFPRVEPASVERFWSQRGFARRVVATRWTFDARDDLAAVLRIEFPPEVAAAALAATTGLAVEVPQVVRSRSW